MNVNPPGVALFWDAILGKTRDLPTILPGTREELIELMMRVGYAHLAIGVGCAGPHVHRFLEWYRVHKKEIAVLQERLCVVVADADE